MKEYAVYKGDDLICMGTAEECASHLGVTPEYIKWMTTPTGKKRLAARKRPERCMTAEVLEVEKDDPVILEVEFDENGYAIIPEEIYEEGKKNGINRDNVYQRINSYFWTAEEAVTVPVGQPRDPLRRLALKNGLTLKQYSRRLYDGMDPVKAATTPIDKKRSELIKRGRKKNG